MKKILFLVWITWLAPMYSQGENPAPTVTFRLKVGDKWRELSDFVAEAASSIKSEHAEFDQKAFRCNFWIDPASADKLISITFSRGIGQTGYRIYFSKDGKISGNWSGILRA